MGQFFLLLWKDWILLRRNKLWTTIELILPCLLLAPFSYILVKYSDTSYSRAVDHDPFTLTGRLQDAPMLLPIGNNCKKNAVLAYTSKGSANKDIAKELMSKVQDRFNNSIEIKNLPDEDKLLETLRKDMPRLGTFCPFNLYVGGVVFETVDVAKKKLKYRILFGKFKGDTWNMRETHTHLYGEWMRPSFNRRSYIESGYLSFQHAIETSFISLMHAGFVDFPIILRELPEPKFYINHVLLFFSWLPSIWQFVALLLTIHIAREISAENLVLKPYLSAMGLSTFVYYAAHIFVGLLKFLVVFSVGVIPLAIIIPFVSPAVLLIFVFLFGIASIVFGALVGSMFSNSNTATQAIMIFTVAGTVVGSKMQPPPENIIGRALFCLNMNGAFSLAIESMKEYIQREMVLDMFSIFNESTIRFSMGCTLLMLIFDIFWMAALTLLVDRIRASGFSLMTMIKTRMKSRKESSSSSSPESDNTVTDWCEVDEARDAAKADIIVNDLVKIYSTGETAVNGLSLRAVQGQVSILLGHNGAGKSTTFSSIAGIIKPTYGSIKICDYDVSEDAKMTKKFIGLCPQTNPLYDQLTVGEHLYLVHGLKGANREEFQEEMQRLLKDVNLDFKEKEKSKNLSGGMKRKLCVCMALIGDSKVILLDEPSAGMDPGARQDVQKLVEKEKANRTVLLTTHYMDEAERLGDWVFVMSHGKLAASGTTQYLKQKFGTGYLLTVVMHHNGDKKRMAELLTSVCQHFVKGAERGEMHGLQVEIILPESQKSSFVTLFKALEAIQEKKFDSVTLATVPSELKEQLARLVMTCFGLSLNSLEQVFIIIGEKYEKALENKMGNNSKQNNYKLLLDSQGREPEKSGAIKVFAQILAILRKKNLYMIRNPFQFLAQIIISLVMLFLISAFLADSDEEKYFSPSDLEPAKALMRFDDSSFPNQIKHFESLVTKYPGFDIRRYNMNKLLSSIVQETIGVVPPIVFGMTVSGNGVEVLYNGRYHHVLPSLVTMVNLARFSGQSSSEAHIQSGVTLFNKPADKDEIPMADFLLLPIVVFVFATFTSTFAVFMVEERECQFAHQQWLTGISPITFYSGSLLFDALCYAFICLIFGFVFHSINWMTSHLGL
uniref:ABC transporter domain-containing protein n=1 Tax=Caenorhabditis japonica TaxID=281687 RepID=A0A8R1DX91_CAEJA